MMVASELAKGTEMTKMMKPSKEIAQRKDLVAMLPAPVTGLVVPMPRQMVRQLQMETEVMMMGMRE